MKNVCRMLCLLCVAFSSVSSAIAALPRELEDAEMKYGRAVKSILEKASDDLDTRKKLAALNESFLAHLRAMSPKLLARNADFGPILEARIEIIKWKTSFSKEITDLDARSDLKNLASKVNPETSVAKTVKGEDVPEGELGSREAGDSVKVGDYFELKGRTKNIPDDHVVQVFALPNWKGMFPREERKSKNKRFAVTETVSEVWVGQMEFYLMCLPAKVMDEVDLYVVERRRWEDGGFKEDAVPLFHGQPTKNLYQDALEELGAVKLSEVKLAYIR